jgi:hypothetical protein
MFLKDTYFRLLDPSFAISRIIKIATAVRIASIAKY